MSKATFGCNSHPDAPHGFDRTASHNAERYVCVCEGWEPPETQEALRLAEQLDAAPYSSPCTNDAAAELRRLHEEVTEQARLLGMGAERELSLLARVDRLERVMKQAQEAIEAYLSAGTEAEDQEASELLCDAWDAIRDALAQSRSDVEQPAPVAEPHKQQEPVSVMTVLHLKDRTEIGYGPASAGYDLPTGEYKLYTSPQPSKPWVGLTQQDIDIAFDDTQEGGGFNEFARAIEAKLKEKNGF